MRTILIAACIVLLSSPAILVAEEEKGEGEGEGQDIVLSSVVGLVGTGNLTLKGKPAGKLDLAFEETTIRSAWFAEQGFKNLTYTAKKTDESPLAPWQFEVDTTNDKGHKLMLRGEFVADETIALKGTVSLIKPDGTVTILQYTGSAKEKGAEAHGKKKGR